MIHPSQNIRNDSRCVCYIFIISYHPYLIFADEIDALTSKRQNAHKDMEKRIVSQLISSFDGELSASVRFVWPREACAGMFSEILILSPTREAY